MCSDPGEDGVALVQNVFVSSNGNNNSSSHSNHETTNDRAEPMQEQADILSLERSSQGKFHRKHNHEIFLM